MFQCDWANPASWEGMFEAVPRPPHPLSRDAIARTALLLWTEHCVECAAPACYSACSLYVPRRDRHCARFAYGIYPHPQFQGLLDYGADVRFRRWGKLTTHFYGRPLSPVAHRRFDRWSRRFSAASTTLGSAINSLVGRNAPGRDPWNGLRKRLLAQAGTAPRTGEYDALVIECFAPDPDPCRLILEYVEDKQGEPRVLCREAFAICPGWNRHELAVAALGYTEKRPRGSLRLTLENDAERRLIFTWLDVVKYQAGFQPQYVGESSDSSGGTAKAARLPADKVKCVAWDLDNTLWTGILVEDGAEKLAPRPEALELVRKLDERGIIQTVCSKNNHDEAWRVIERLDLQDVFLYPAIHWGRKSGSLPQIAERLNINLDTFALIDDSPFERAEVSQSHPQVRVYSDRQIGDLLSLPPFDVPITVASRSRRQTYLENMQRDRVQAGFSGNYDDFLRDCRMRLRLFVPRTEDEIARCLEILQRTNQLNLSSRRYSADEFHALLSDERMLSLALDCSDRFGNYGIVGMATIDESGPEPALVDFCLSCRVAQKKVEHAFLKWLAERAGARGSSRLLVRLKRTARNSPLLTVFDELPFETLKSEGDSAELGLGVTKAARLETVVELEAIVAQ